MFGEGKGEQIFVGIVSLVVVGLLVRRIVQALRTAVILLYRTRLSRAEAGDAKFNALVVLNVAAAILMAVIATDLLLELDWL